MTLVGFLVLLLAASSALAFILAVVVGPRRNPGARPFLGLMTASAVWSLAYAFELAARDLPRVLFWLRVEYVGIPFVGVFWFLIVLELTRKPPRSAGAWYLLLLPAIAFSALAWTNARHGWFHVAPELSTDGPLPLLRFERGPAYWANWGYTWLLLAAGTLRLLRIASRGAGVDRRHAFYLFAAMAVPAVFNAAYAAGFRPGAALDLTPFGFTIGGALLLWGVLHAALFSLVPTARAHVFERIPDGILVSDERGWLMDFNPAAERLLGPLAMARPIDESPGVWPSLRMAMQQMAFADTTGNSSTLTSSAHEATVSSFGDPRRGHGVVAVVRDMRERQRAETELRYRERLLSVLSEVARLLLPARGLPDLDAIMRLLGEATGADHAYVGLNEFRDDGALCVVPRAVWRAEDVSFEQDAASPGRMAYDEAGLADWRHRLAAGEIVHGRTSDFGPEPAAFLVPRRIRVAILIPLFTEEGFAGIVGCERRRSDELWSGVEQEFLRSASLYLSLALRRQRTEDALQQAQKLDTVGRLAGGIAHDFNNLLQVINGYTDMALVGLADDDPRASDLREVLRAGQRAAALTQQLLSFSRRQVVAPEPNDVHAAIGDMRALLRRLLGERVTLEFRFEAREPVVDVGVPHIEQIVLNLAVNARDAMPDGGSIRIATRNLEVDADQSRARGMAEGRYLSLNVEDTGAGMSADVLSHLFEPFFTTKPRGRGTGLGLATVYGLVRQHRGHISVQSVLGQGSQFTILLPVSRGERAAPETAAAGPVTAAAGGTLLVVEDEDSVRRLWIQVLGGAGYHVLEAESGEAALDVAHAHGGTIDALISDVMMPGLSGHQIAAILTTERPQLRVLLISGYPEDADGEDAPETPRFPFLSKPVSTETLLLRVRELLEGEPPR